jgi:hypothetical protein
MAANSDGSRSGHLADYIIETLSVAAWGMDWAAMEGEGSNKLKNDYHATAAFFKLNKYAVHFKDMFQQAHLAEIKGKGSLAEAFKKYKNDLEPALTAHNHFIQM